MATVGVFDSGVGGLSVLRALRADMPDARFVYVADSAFAPYGERNPGEVLDRCTRITAWLLRHSPLDALVVACNTATALAIDMLREQHPGLPIVGIEPALKPAARITRSGHVGVLATRATLASERFGTLRTRLETQHLNRLVYHCVAADGLADAIERADTASVAALCQRYLHALGIDRAGNSPVDVLVLGCTHYPLVSDLLESLLRPQVMLMETGQPVARQTRRLLMSAGRHALTPTPGAPPAPDRSGIELFSTGEPERLWQAARQWLPDSDLPSDPTAPVLC